MALPMRASRNCRTANAPIPPTIISDSIKKVRNLSMNISIPSKSFFVSKRVAMTHEYNKNRLSTLFLSSQKSPIAEKGRTSSPASIEESHAKRARKEIDRGAFVIFDLSYPQYA